jgi:threonine aldolase
MRQQFLSDNNAGICPEALAAMMAENATGHMIGYGDDDATQKAEHAIAELFETDCAVFFVFNGTGANALALAQLCQPYHAVIAHGFSHVQWDEANAVGFFGGGASQLTIDTPAAKLTLEAVEQKATQFEGVHHVKVNALTLTQSTELGTIYALDELAAFGELAKRHKLKFHMDGARFANAVASLGTSPADMSWRRGVDVLSFGGVKNGLAVGECVVFFDKSLTTEFEWRRKQAGQLNSKMRFVTAPWLGLLQDDVWLKNARHANAMAQRMAVGLTAVDGVELMHPVEANGVFVHLPPALQKGLRDKGWEFYTFVPPTGCRLMSAWDTTAETIDAFLADVKSVAGEGQS